MTDSGSLVLRGLLDPETDFDQLAWQPFHPGVDIVELYPQSEEGCHAALLRYHPGTCVPFHLHSGYEHILILRGSQRDSLGVYEAGTLVIKQPGTSHQVFSDDGCVVLAVWQKPVQIMGDANTK